ncbi:hypothetical protein LJC62_01380 [Odoribacter sp. OttesenSCG-928-A06]|nr:hypothetical protein [Odoribacter sp. OttesenSCG-928-A06]
MTTDINDYIRIVRQKNGQIRIKHDVTNEGNIYKLLREFGFCQFKLDNRTIYYRRQNDELTKVDFNDIKRAFYDFLKEGNYTCPKDVSRVDILNWYLEKLPLKKNGLLKHYLEDTLSEQEIHSLRLQIDFDYKHNFEIQQILSKLDEWNFKKTIDTKSSIATNAPLYYKQVDSDKYLIFSHWNADRYIDKKKKHYRDGFDCWLAKFKNEKDIGKKKIADEDLQDIRLGFYLNRDLPLLSSI